MSEPNSGLGAAPAEIMAIDMIEFVASPSRVYIGETVTFYANASSDTSSSLTFTIYYDSRLSDLSNNTASPYSVNATDSPGEVVTTFTYDHVGNLTGSLGTYFSVNLVVSDGISTDSLRIRVYVVDNALPEFTIHPQGTINADPNETILLSVKLTDVDDDPLHVVWDFGDGSPQAVNDTPEAGSGVYVNQSHAWDPPIDQGRGGFSVYYELNVTAEDGAGNSMTWISNITVEIPENWSPEIRFFTANTTVSTGVPITLRANASDAEGEPLTWTFVFNNSVEVYDVQVYHTNATDPNAVTWINLTHEFLDVGSYVVVLYVSDALIPFQFGAHNVSQKLSFTVVENRMPFVGSVSILYPTPVILINSTTGTVEVGLSVRVLDEDGDALTAVWDFGDGSDFVTSTTSAGTGFKSIIQEHSYNATGYYNVTVTVTDGFVGHEVSSSRIITVNSTNLGPTLESLRLNLSHGTYGAPHTLSTICVVLMDPEMDALMVTFYFGDGSDWLVVNCSDYDDEGRLTVTVNHTYTAVKEYTVIIIYTDNKVGQGAHTGEYNAFIRISVPLEQEVRVWNWWDSTSLAFVFAMIAIVIARVFLVGVYRKRLDQYGMTYEEYILRRKDLKEWYKASKIRTRETLKPPAGKTADGGRAKSIYDETLSRLRSERRDKSRQLRRLLRSERVPESEIPLVEEAD